MQALFNDRHCPVHIQTARLVLILFIPYRLKDLIGYVLHEALRLTGNCCAYSPTMLMSQYDYQPGSQMIRRIFNTSKLMLIHHITCYTDYK